MDNQVQRSRQFFVEAAYRPRDKVRFGPHDAYVTKILVGTNGITYSLIYWVADEQKVSDAYEWELTLLEEGSE